MNRLRVRRLRRLNMPRSALGTGYPIELKQGDKLGVTGYTFEYQAPEGEANKMVYLCWGIATPGGSFHDFLRDAITNDEFVGYGPIDLAPGGWRVKAETFENPPILTITVPEITVPGLSGVYYWLSLDSATEDESDIVLGENGEPLIVYEAILELGDVLPEAIDLEAAYARVG